MKKMILAGLLLGSTSVADAAVLVDGVREGDYGTRTARVTYSPTAPDSNFQSPTNTTRWSSYNIYLKAADGYLYGFFEADGDASIVGTFANLYFDLDPTVGNGSDIGFELSTGPGNTRYFLPGTPGSVVRTDILVANGNGGLAFETGIPIGYFTGDATLPYYADQTFENVALLRLSQTFGFSVAGGASYGPNRLGAFNVGDAVAAVPEPSTWSMLILGFGLVGGAMRRRRVATKVAFA